MLVLYVVVDLVHLIEHIERQVALENLSLTLGFVILFNKWLLSFVVEHLLLLISQSGAVSVHKSILLLVFDISIVTWRWCPLMIVIVFHRSMTNLSEVSDSFQLLLLCFPPDVLTAYLFCLISHFKF